jgi:hypothetical protein
MTRLTAWCLLALLAYGRTVGCLDGTHRDAYVVCAPCDQVPGAVLYHHVCACGARVPFTERVRAAK